MSLNLVNKLYDIYCNNHNFVAEMKFRNILNSVKKEDIISALNEYINANSDKFPSYYASFEKQQHEDEMIDNLDYCFEMIAIGVNELLDDYDNKFSKVRGREDCHETITSHNLFKLNEFTLKKACEEYCHVSDKIYNQIFNIIRFVKSKDLLNKVYKNIDYTQLPFRDVLLALYDYSNKNKVFDVNFEGEEYLLEASHEAYAGAGFFDAIKKNCANVLSIPFDGYRPMLVSKKVNMPELDKLIFCRNLLAFYETGMLTDRSGLIYGYFDKYDEEKLIDKFKKLYSSRFNEDYFVSKQANIICCDKTLSIEPDKIIGYKHHKKDNSLVMGILLDADVAYYLIHVYIEDINNEKGNYEIQLNLLPDGKIQHRIQLVRLDNRESVTPHRNVAKKLTTHTHIHLYNHFDLLRGKINGAYDIAYNLEDESASFNKAVNTFVDILGLDNNLTNKLKNIIISCKEKYLSGSIK